MMWAKAGGLSLKQSGNLIDPGPLRLPGALSNLPSSRGMPGQSSGARPRSLKPGTGTEWSLPEKPQRGMWNRKADQGARVLGSQARGPWTLEQVLRSLCAGHSAPPAGPTREGAVGAELLLEGATSLESGCPHKDCAPHPLAQPHGAEHGGKVLAREISAALSVACDLPGLSK